MQILLVTVGLIGSIPLVYLGWRRSSAAAAFFLIGFAPLIANRIGNGLASWLACRTHELMVYTCRVGSTDISALLTLMVTAGIFFVFTVPFVVASIVLMVRGER